MDGTMQMPARHDDSLDARLDRLGEQLALLVERQRKQAEMLEELAPILRLAMGVATERLGDLEQRGYFAFGAELLGILDRVVTSYPPDDVRALGDQVVRILDTVRNLTQPDVLAIANEATAVLHEADRVAPLGVVGMVKASRDEDVQRGMAVMMEVLRHVGRAAKAGKQDRPRLPSPRARTEAPATTRTAPRQGIAPAAAGPVCKPVQPGKVATTLDGVAYTADGFLADPQQWTRELAATLAAAHGVVLTDAHWQLLDFARAEYQQTHVSPNIRRLTAGTGLSTKEIYAMFPKAPGKTAALLAGIPKPAGCI